MALWNISHLQASSQLTEALDTAVALSLRAGLAVPGQFRLIRLKDNFGRLPAQIWPLKHYHVFHSLSYHVWSDKACERRLKVPSDTAGAGSHPGRYGNQGRGGIKA
ncbi:hypothetical protein SRHO_G00205180 [Serrasalmus rhombeus]